MELKINIPLKNYSMCFLQVLLIDQHPPVYFYVLISLFKITLITHLLGSPDNLFEL